MDPDAPTVDLRPVERGNLRACLALELDARQRELVAPVARSLAEAYVDPALRPYAIYDGAGIGYEEPVAPPVGFAMLEVRAGVGFLLRLLIDRRQQRRGYGGATVREAVRRLRLEPAVRLIATSHRRENLAAAELFRREGFVPWEVDYAREHPTEVYLRLPGTA